MECTSSDMYCLQFFGCDLLSGPLYLARTTSDRLLRTALRTGRDSWPRLAAVTTRTERQWTTDERKEESYIERVQAR